MRLYKSLKIYVLMVAMTIAAIGIYFSHALAEQRNGSDQPVSGQLTAAQPVAVQAMPSAQVAGVTATQTQPQPPRQTPRPSNKLAANPAPAQAAANSANYQQIPVNIQIPAINLNATVVKTGLEANGALHVPSNPNISGWYDLGPKPGEIGPAVITGHLDSAAGPGVFWNLKNVRIGDEINVVRDDGSVAVFKVSKMQTYPQNNFNTQAVYGAISNAGLRVITCAGTYIKSLGHYSDDLVVYADLIAIR